MLRNLSLAKIYLEHDIQYEYFMTQGNEKGINFAFNWKIASILNFFMSFTVLVCREKFHWNIVIYSSLQYLTKAKLSQITIMRLRIKERSNIYFT